MVAGATTIPQGSRVEVHPKRAALERGDDIVWSAWGHAGVHIRTGSD